MAEQIQAGQIQKTSLWRRFCRPFRRAYIRVCQWLARVEDWLFNYPPYDVILTPEIEKGLHNASDKEEDEVTQIAAGAQGAEESVQSTVIQAKAEIRRRKDRQILQRVKDAREGMEGPKERLKLPGSSESQASFPAKIIVGRMPRNEEVQYLHQHEGVQHVIAVIEDSEYRYHPNHFRNGMLFTHCDAEDRSAKFNIGEFLAADRAIRDSYREKEVGVDVHCSCGRGRSTALTLFALLRLLVGYCNFQQVFLFLLHQRSVVSIGKDKMQFILDRAREDKRLTEFWQYRGQDKAKIHSLRRLQEKQNKWVSEMCYGMDTMRMSFDEAFQKYPRKEPIPRELKQIRAYIEEFVDSKIRKPKLLKAIDAKLQECDTIHRNLSYRFCGA